MGADVEAEMKQIVDEKNNCVYIGQVENGGAHGHGEMVCKEPKTRYNGEWSFGKFHGSGLYSWDNGSYEGSFSHGSWEGMGKLQYERDGMFCLAKAAFKKASREGYGYEACIKKEAFGGYGPLRQAFDEVEGPGYNFFEGNYRNNRFHGPCVSKYDNGSIMRGIFVNGHLSGLGNLKEKNGKEYLLVLRKGVVSGRVVQRELDGNIYEYFQKDGKMVGQNVQLLHNHEFEEYQENFPFKPKRINY